jgi:hypothetical protein
MWGGNNQKEKRGGFYTTFGLRNDFLAWLVISEG